MGVYINMEMPKDGTFSIVHIYSDGHVSMPFWGKGMQIVSGITAVPVPPHGDLIDRDALIKDGWLNLHKEVIRMGGYAIHELPLKNPSIPVIVPAEEGET